MSERPPKHPPRRTKSGESAAVKDFRARLDSIAEGTFPALEELNRQAEELRESVVPPKPKNDPRREDEGEPPIDVVETQNEAPKEPKT